MSWDDRYGEDVLSGNWKAAGRPVIPSIAVEIGMVVERDDGYVGEVVGWEKGRIELEDRHGARRWFPIGHGYLVDGRPSQLTAPAVQARGRARTASGSFAAATDRARVAQASRIFVEGRHDAELVEAVWGADLRVEGVVVEYLSGVDHLSEVLTEFQPGPTRRVGVLVDHLVPGSKESRIAQEAMAGPWRGHVLVVGHPFIDVWQSVKPERLGWAAWPEIPRGIDWKHGVCAAAGWPHEDQADIARAWQHILGRVRDFRDLEPELLGRVEELIDFVTTN